jgi:hypothetical protein
MHVYQLLLCLRQCVLLRLQPSLLTPFLGWPLNRPPASHLLPLQCGRVSMIGDWAGYANHVNVGAIMEKGLTIRSGLTPMQKVRRRWADYVGRMDGHICANKRVGDGCRWLVKAAAGV